MLSSKLSGTSWLTCFFLAFALFVTPLAAMGTQAVERVSERRASSNLKVLSQYGVDLTEMAQRGSLEPVNGYSAQIQSALRILARETKNNPVLLGEARAARSFIVEGVAQRIAEGNAPANLLNKRVFSLSLESLSAGAAGREEFNARFEAVLSETRSAQGEIILFVDGLDDLLTEDSSVNASVANMLEAALAHDELRLIGAATPESFSAKLARREGFKGKLQEIFIDSTTEDTAKASDDKNAADQEARNSEAFVGDKIAPELNELIQNSNSSSESVGVILQGNALSNSNLHAFLRRNRIETTGEYNNLKAQAIQIPTSLISQLVDFDQVSYMSLDRETVSLGHVEKTTGADEVREVQKTAADGTVKTIKVTGGGVGIAILDSGIYASHKAFLDSTGTKSRVVLSKDFTGEGRTDDPYGHGTHVASLAAGNNRVAGGAYTGIAPDANIVITCAC